MRLRLTALILMCLFVLALPARAETVTVGIGVTKPPYIIQKDNKGFELELINRALEIAGYKMKPKFMPIVRILHELNGGALDAGAHLRANMAVDGFFSDVVTSYQNYGITLQSSPVKLKNVKDLENYSVLAFSNARVLLGEEFKEMTGKNKQYSEVSNQLLQVKMLAAGRVQAVVSDFRIFLHFKKEYEKQSGTKVKVKFHRIFPPTPYRVAFQSRTIRDDFDRGLRKMLESGEYHRIVEKYISKEDVKALN